MISAHNAESIQKGLKELDRSLSASFAKLKQDMAEQSATLEHLNGRMREQDSINAQIKGDIAQLRAEIESVSSRNASVPAAKPRDSGLERIPATELTQLHMRVLKCIMILQVESGRRTISMKKLAEELYPQKTYTSIKTTLSRYLKRLEQHGLIRKTYNGRLYLSYTEKALEFADNERLSRMRELISRNTGR